MKSNAKTYTREAKPKKLAQGEAYDSGKGRNHIDAMGARSGVLVIIVCMIVRSDAIGCSRDEKWVRMNCLDLYFLCAMW